MADRILDPNFDMPPNVVDLSWAPVERDESDEISEAEAVELELVDYDYVEESPESGSTLLPPDDATLIEFRPKISSDGTVLVDAVFEVTGPGGTSNFEARVQKV